MTIPRPLQIVMDDLGWFNGKDDRQSGGPSRTGAERKHCHKDYIAVNELGKRLDMKINCAFVLGEWDDDNRLASIKNLSKYKEGWDNARYFDKDEAARCVRAINESEYIDMAIHGLLHGYYADGIDNVDESDYYYKVNKEQFTVCESEIRARLDAFLDLVKHHGINKNINSFVPPSFTYKRNDISHILADYGIEFISTIFKQLVCEGERPEIADVENGIVSVDRNNNKVKWNGINEDPSALPALNGIFGMHWPNILHTDPDRNIEAVERWAEYFERCSQEFGTILSKDMRFCASQSLFCRFAKIKEDRGITIVDISEVPTLVQTNREFYISSKEPLESYVGCDVYSYEQKDGFWTYRIVPITNVMRFDNV